MNSGSLLGVGLYLSAALFVMGFVAGPLGAFLTSLFPTRVRYTGTAVSFNTGGVIGGGVAPFVAQALSQHGGLAPVGVCLAGAALITLVGLLPLGRRAEPELGLSSTIA
jgi:hypothetical protein